MDLQPIQFVRQGKLNEVKIMGRLELGVIMRQTGSRVNPNKPIIHSLFFLRLIKVVGFFCLFISVNSDLSHEWDSHSFHRRHHEPVARQRFPPFWVLLLGGQGRTWIQHHFHHRALPDEPSVRRAGDLWWWANNHCTCWTTYTTRYHLWLFCTFCFLLLKLKSWLIIF